ncbi:MAG TPA: hypothetical protein VFZ34_27930 [Blastocatellia bacterium]|nr:hypothetical protein [Blastocatellia bacterium]
MCDFSIQEAICKDGQITYKLLANGYELSSHLQAHYRRMEEPQDFSIEITREEDYFAIEDCLLVSFPENISEIHISQIFKAHSSVESVRFDSLSEGNFISGYISIQHDVYGWAQPFGYKVYVKKFYERVTQIYPSGFDFELSDMARDLDRFDLADGLDLYIVNIRKDQSLNQIISECLSCLKKLENDVVGELLIELSANSLITHFDFPSELKTACQQYLLYFVDFLRDLGVEAKAEIRQTAGTTFFSVTPTNKNDALDKIRTALDVYLELPSNPILNGEIEGQDSIAIQRLSANVHHLQGQVMLAQALLQAKDATIEAQRTTIENQQRLINNKVLVDSLVEVKNENKPSEKEEFLGSTVALTKYQGKGFEINLAEIYRKLRQYLSK